MLLLLSWMNFNNSACFGYGSNVTKPSFNDTILKYFLQKYNMSCLHLLISLALRLNSSGVRISFSPAFLIDASSPVGLLGVFCYVDANWLSCGFPYPRSKFSNLSIVGFSNSFWDICNFPLFNYTIFKLVYLRGNEQKRLVPERSRTNQCCCEVGCYSQP